jgi:hypothetical protein
MNALKFEKAFVRLLKLILVLCPGVFRIIPVPSCTPLHPRSHHPAGEEERRMCGSVEHLQAAFEKAEDDPSGEEHQIRSNNNQKRRTE